MPIEACDSSQWGAYRMAAGGVLWALGFLRSLSITGNQMGAAASADEATAAFVSVLRSKSPATVAHSERVAEYAAALALALDLPYAQVRHLERCGLLHDIGKMGVAEEILDKPGALSDQEWHAVRAHPEMGVDILRSCPALSPVLPVVELHHERYDGQGYPHGIGGTDLPLEVRIVTICDAYDSMTADRPYRRGLDRAEAARRLTAGAGTQFDADLVRTFLSRVFPEVSASLAATA
jgi:putative nucleotidyltransferase with HDIG domain